MPETILQFGAGRFLRAFVDRFVQNANDQGHAVGRVVVVQSTPGRRADLINEQPDGYHVLVRGYDEGKLYERTEHVQSIARALVAQDCWSQVLEAARLPSLRYIVTNATEAGYDLDAGDRLDSAPPASMPGKLTRVLWERFQAGEAPVVVLPCELIEGNASKLLAIVTALARDWLLPTQFAEWLSLECQWLNNLVDCIVTPVPADVTLPAWDKMPVSAEPFALWAIQRPAGSEPRLFPHPAIHVVDDLTPYYLRKVRILNGLHSAMAAKFRPAGFLTVLEVMSDREALRWLRGLCYEEIVPTIAYRVDNAALFADQTFDRFRNPFLAHKLADIVLNHEAKVKVRLQPTRDEYARLFGRAPRKLCEVLGG
ncbi:MAG: altronate dehydrogenase [Planctomycetaceae bacterium]|nr:altronate dehydrogenase [Planctomycetaceae bacterium]